MQTQKLTDEIRDALKAANPDRPLFKKTLFGTDFVFSYITREEYLRVQDWVADNPSAKVSDVDEKLVEVGLLWPQISPTEWATLPAGAVPTLSNLIQEKSALGEEGLDEVAKAITEEKAEERPDGDVLESLKKKSPFPLKLVRLQGSYYVIRPMVRVEYTTINKQPADVDSDVEGCKKCVLFPKSVDWEKVPAGVPTALVRQILAHSGFSAPGEVEEL